MIKEKVFQDNELDSAYKQWVAVAPLSTHPADRLRMAKVAYLLLENEEIVSYDTLAMHTKMSPLDKDIEDALVAIEMMQYAYKFLKKEGRL